MSLTSRLLKGQSAVVNQSASGSIAATLTTGSAYYWRSGPSWVTARIAGTYAGSIEIQSADPDSSNWATVLAVPANTTCVLNMQVFNDQDFRIVSTAWTSGTAYTSLSSN